MPKSPEEMAQAMFANLEEKTGKTREGWLEQLAKDGFTAESKHGQIVQHLKAKHGVTHGFANLISHELRKPPEGAPGEDDLVAAQYSGPKADLKPIYDALIARIQKFGDDVEIAPKKSYVSLRRSKQFALIQPSTKTRVDVGINLKGEKPSQRLEESGSFNAMVSHRVRVTEAPQVDDQLIEWLREAYERA